MIGSRIIGQGFSSPGYFRPRPSAAGTGYDAANSAGSQLGPTNKKLIDAVKANVEAARKENPNAPVPIDLVTTSASGLGSAHLARRRRFPGPARGPRARHCRRRMFDASWQPTPPGSQLGFFGEPGVNVLELNLALDAEYPIKK